MVGAPQLSAALAGACLLAAIAWLVSSEFPVVDPGKPTIKAGPVLILEAAVPAIGTFDQFNINDINPFVPFNLRVTEIGAIKTPAKIGPKSQPKPQQTPEVPKIVLPKIGASSLNAPKATGVLLSQAGAQAFLTYHGDANATMLKPGDSVKGWTLVEVIGTNVVRMKDDSTGVVHDLVIAETANEAKKKPDAKDTKETKDGKDVKDASGKKTDASSANEGKPNGQIEKADKGNVDKAKAGKKPGTAKPSNDEPEPPSVPAAPTPPAAQTPPEKML